MIVHQRMSNMSFLTTFHVLFFFLVSLSLER